MEDIHNELKTPFKFVGEMIFEKTIKTIVDQSNKYTLSTNHFELKTTEKEIKLFISLYL